MRTSFRLARGVSANTAPSGRAVPHGNPIAATHRINGTKGQTVPDRKKPVLLAYRVEMCGFRGLAPPIHLNGHRITSYGARQIELTPNGRAGFAGPTPRMPLPMRCTSPPAMLSTPG